MNCQNCGAPMKFDHAKLCYVCDYCTSIYFPEESRDGIRVTDESSRFSCPVCHIPLVLAYADEIQVFHCPKCRGVLLDQPKFLFVIQSLRSKAKGHESIPPRFQPQELERKIFCPQCSNKMDTHPYGGPGNVVVDNCPRCRLIWLDYTELHRITHSPDRIEWESLSQADYDKLFGSRKTRSGQSQR